MATRKSVGRVGTDQRLRPSAESSADLEALLVVAARIDIEDDGAMEDLRQRAMEITADLAAAGRIPAHLVVAPDDPAVVVVRTIAAVSRLAAARYPIPVEAGPLAAFGRHRPRERTDGQVDFQGPDSNASEAEHGTVDVRTSALLHLRRARSRSDH